MSLDPAILGLLRQRGPLTGYQIKQDVEKSIGDFWSITFGGLYPALARMVEKGSLDVVESEGETRLYQITPRGEREFAGWILQPTKAVNVKNDFLLKLYWANDEEIRQLAGQVSERLASRVRALEELKRAQREDNPTKGQWFTIQLGIDSFSADIQWLKELLLWILQDETNEH